MAAPGAGFEHDPSGRRPVTQTYSPERRTALVFSGTGAHGAYHAGVLRALQDAGVRIDLVAGHGIGAGAAALAAIDGGARLWDPGGIWRSPATPRLYGWKSLLRLVGWTAVVVLVLLAIPLVVLGLAFLVYPLAFLLTLVGLSAGPSLVDLLSGWLQSVFSPQNLPTIVPRLVTLALVLLCMAIAAGALHARWRAPARRRFDGGWWWLLFGAPLDASGARSAFVNELWRLIRGAATGAPGDSRAVGRRFADVLGESLGQPGFRELIVVATDLDARCDLVVAMLREPFRAHFLAPRPGGDRRVEVLDLAGAGREGAVDVIAAALTPPVGCDPALVTFGHDSYWRGETHRLCDRPASLNRLLAEVDAAGVRQVIVVTAVAQVSGPHRLQAPGLDPRRRLGDYLAAEESIAVQEAVAYAAQRFESVYVVSPPHNALGPFDFDGIYDESSDRRLSVTELLDQGYSDAHRQFVEPVVGASGEQMPTGLSAYSAR